MSSQRSPLRVTSSPSGDPAADEAVLDEERVPLKSDVAPRPPSAPSPSVKVRRGKGRTISIKRLAKQELELGRLLYPDLDVPRPRSRAECQTEERPCPFVSCRHHLYLDVSPKSGAIKLNFPDADLEELADTCVLDVADRGGTTLEEVGTIMNLTRERVRQLELSALDKVQRAAERFGLAPEVTRVLTHRIAVDRRHLPLVPPSEGHTDTDEEPSDT